MTRATCSRLWQVEAIHDGRLSGKDLELAERHRLHCTDCATEARNLAELSLALSTSPELPRDPLSVRRSRQRLLAAVNDSIIASPPVRSHRFAAVLAIVSVATLGVALGVFRMSRAPAPVPRKSLVEVRSIADARWHVQDGPAFEQ